MTNPGRLKIISIGCVVFFILAYFTHAFLRIDQTLMGKLSPLKTECDCTIEERKIENEKTATDSAELIQKKQGWLV